MKKLLGITLLLAIVGITVVATASDARKENLKSALIGPFINNFKDCVQTGFPTTYGSQPYCKVSDHKIFFGLSQPASPTATASSLKTSQPPGSTPILSTAPSSPESEAFDPLKNISSTTLPDRVLLEVPFTPQAPLANWDPPFDESCEEASIIMVERYLAGQQLNTEQATTAIATLASWVSKNGYAIDATAAEAAEIATKYFGLKAKLYFGAEVSMQNIKTLLALGYPVIIPAAGRELGNPFFSGEGPPYHMLVIIGYKGDKFVTHDPGTKRGAGYVYSQAIILNAIHDWTGAKETISQGKKAMFILDKS